MAKSSPPAITSDLPSSLPEMAATDLASPAKAATDTAAAGKPKAGQAANIPNLPANYEAALQELESLVGRLESGQLPLDQLLTGYQRGAVLLQFCRQRLEAVEHQIKVLDGAELKPWPVV